MKLPGILLMSLIMLLLVSSISYAGDYDWMPDFNVAADADSSGFRARLETRFKVGDVEIKAVLGNVDKPADAYMLFRLGEMSDQSIDHVIETYKANKDKGWGVIAQGLGIKPGSEEFHALKQGQDLYDDSNANKGNAKSKGKGKGKK